MEKLGLERLSYEALRLVITSTRGTGGGRATGLVDSATWVGRTDGPVGSRLKIICSPPSCPPTHPRAA